MAMTQDLARIARTNVFQDRVQLAMTTKALADFSASSGDERAMIQRILRNEARMLAWTMAVLADPNIQVADQSIDGSSITDAQITAAVAAAWPAFVG